MQGIGEKGKRKSREEKIKVRAEDREEKVADTRENRESAVSLGCLCLWWQGQVEADSRTFTDSQLNKEGMEGWKWAEREEQKKKGDAETKCQSPNGCQPFCFLPAQSCSAMWLISCIDQTASIIGPPLCLFSLSITFWLWCQQCRGIMVALFPGWLIGINPINPPTHLQPSLSQCFNLGKAVFYA